MFKNYLKIIRYILWLSSVVLAFYIGYRYGGRSESGTTVTEVKGKDTLIQKIDTVVKKIPVYKTSIVKDTIIVYYPQQARNYQIDTVFQYSYFDSVLIIQDSIRIAFQADDNQIRFERAQRIWGQAKVNVLIEGENIHNVNISPKSISELVNVRIKNTNSPYWLGGGIAYTGKITPFIMWQYRTKNIYISAIAGYNLVGVGVSINLPK